MTSYLLCAAVDAELASLLPRLDSLRDRTGLRVEVASIGIGPVEAALGAAEALASVRPAAAILLGTCGALPGSGLSIGDAVVVQRSILTSSDAAAGFAYIPAPMQREALADEALLSRLALRLPGVSCATVVAITHDQGHAEAEARHTGCQVEHLEAYAFLRAAERAGVPALCVLGVANDVGPDAHTQWRQFGDLAASAAVEAVIVALGGL